MTPDQTPLAHTPLHDLHVELGARLVPFAGHAMPVQYPAGIMAEHTHCRARAGLFDVSHMGQVCLTGTDAAARLETLVPGDLQALTPGRMRYTLFTNDRGGILDDLMVTRREDDLFLVVNAACKDQDIAHLRQGVGADRVTVLTDRALLALQGPEVAAVMARHAPGAADLKFMRGAFLTVAGQPCFVTRSGYTGEDGYEISCPAEGAEALARALLAEEAVAPVGLGARDSLRLEAGLCLYGSDLTEDTTPVEAGLRWTVNKRRRETGDFPGAEVILRQMRDGPARLRVGLKPDGRAPARAHTPIVDDNGTPIGEVTSGGFGPSVGGPVAMGYVPAPLAEPGTTVTLMVRNKPQKATVCALPFIAQRYHKA